MKLNSLEIADKKANLVKRNLDIVKLAKSECREMTEDEDKEFCANEEEIQKLDEEQKDLDAELNDEKEQKDENPDETPKDDEPKEDEQRNKTNKSNIRKMKYNLMKELRSALETGKTINLRAYTVTSEGADLVQTDVYDILTPLRAKNVLVAAGAKYMTGLVGDVQIPVMSAGNVAWAAEGGAASDGSGSFAHVSLSPKRLTAKFPISLQFLAQDSVDAEGAIREDIINAINDKLEATILGSAAGTTTQPAGMFNGYVANTTKIADFGDVADLEAAIEAANVYGECKYILSPSAKAALRAMPKGTNAGAGMVMDNGAVDGTEALSTSHVPTGDLVYGDFSNLIIGAWDNVQLDVVRDTDSLVNGCVTIVVNAFFDAAVARAAAFKVANV